MVGQFRSMSEEIHGLRVTNALGYQGLANPCLDIAGVKRLCVSEGLVGKLCMRMCGGQRMKGMEHCLCETRHA